MGKWQLIRSRVNRSYDYDEILHYIIHYKLENNGNSPSTRDIMLKFDIPSTSVVARIIDTLVAEGKLKRSGRCRQIEVPGIRVEYDPSASLRTCAEGIGGNNEANPCPTELLDAEASIA